MSSVCSYLVIIHSNLNLKRLCIIEYNISIQYSKYNQIQNAFICEQQTHFSILIPHSRIELSLLPDAKVVPSGKSIVSRQNEYDHPIWLFITLSQHPINVLNYLHYKMLMQYFQERSILLRVHHHDSNLINSWIFKYFNFDSLSFQLD
ncbi:unnamed protein product [Paramecium sonneborni]|uniref:Uncharacterized protein n=1 Tax=Paramecium sonneborni TaxID=65129 RepID=A0A8S1QY98_9CILI|nr:unnamed protein product [Paramecium sonneborni]